MSGVLVIVEAIDVLEVLDALEAEGVATCLDGDWGVDALIGRLCPW